MYPAQTSLIPVQVALVRFFENQGWQAIFSNYPYWYLGTTPFRYLTGPILPIFAWGLHKILPFLSLFEIFLGIIGMMWVIGGIGVYLLVEALTGQSKGVEEQESRRKEDKTAFLAAMFYSFGPIVPFLFRFSGGLYLMVFSLLPYVYAKYAKFLRRERPRKSRRSVGTRGRRESGIWLCLLITFIILLDSSVIPTLILGMAVVFLATTGWKKAEEKLKQSLSILFFAFLASTLWYTPGYWLTSLTGPSLAGKGRLEVIFQLSKLLPTALALIMAFVSAKFFKKRHLLRNFCFYWLFIFGFLTSIRFISDPDFWMDWTAYGVELQFGLGIALGLVLNNWLVTLKHGINAEARKISAFHKIFCVSALPLVLFGSWFFLFNKYVIGTLQPDITQTVEYQIGKWLDIRVKEQESRRVESPAKSDVTSDRGVKVFLSGTTAFWFNAFFDIPQVRGGKDEVSVHPTWRKAVWEIREGTEVEKSVKWLKDLGVSYLVIHTEDSEEFYHDFSYPEKFEEVPKLKKIYDEEGDRVYKLED